MKKVILIRYGEIILKGLNRPIFEEKLMRNIKKALGKGGYTIWKSQARVFIEPVEGETFEIDRIIVQNSLDNSTDKYLLFARQSVSDVIPEDNLLFGPDGQEWIFNDNNPVTRE